jgi:hypothetical protein
MPVDSSSDFNFREWALGLTLKCPPGWVHGVEKGSITIARPRKPKRATGVLRPAIPAMADMANDGQRSYEDHKRQISMMAARYTRGCDPLTNEPLTDETELDRVNNPNPDYKAPPWAAERSAAYNEGEILNVLTEWAKACYDNGEDSDDDTD